MRVVLSAFFYLEKAGKVPRVAKTRKFDNEPTEEEDQE